MPAVKEKRVLSIQRRHTMKGNYVLEIRQDKNGKWYIRPKAPNGRVLNHEYNSLKGAERGAKLFLKINRIKIVKK